LGSADVLTVQQARAKAKQHLADVQQGADPMTEKRERGETLRAFLDGPYKEHVLSRRRNPATGDSDLRRIRRNFADLLDKRLNQISAFDVEKWTTQKRKSGLSAKSANNYVGLLKTALNAAVRLRLLDENPLRHIRPLQDINAGGRVRFLTDEERTALERAMADRYNTWLRERGMEPYPDLRAVRFADYLQPMYIISTNTGVRQNELFSLQWVDIDFARRTLTVRPENAKNGRVRHIPLNDLAQDTLMVWREQTGGDGLVFKSPATGGKFNNVNRSWRQVMKDAKLTDFRWHDLRHEFASRLVQSGVDLNTTRELLGHSGIQMSLRYSHLSPAHRADAVARINDWSTRADNVVAFEADAKTIAD